MSYPGKIYRITYQGCNAPYYGSTKWSIEKRFESHNKDYKRYLIGKKSYVTSFEILKNENCYIELVEDYPCKDRGELEDREQYYIDNNICVNKDNCSKKNSDKKKYDYSKGKIYMITYEGCEKPYYGSTIQKLNRRFTGGHKPKYKKYIEKRKVDYCNSFEILKNENCYIKLVEDYPCNNDEELRIREQYYLDNFPCINKTNAYVSEKEKKRQDNLKSKKWRDKNK